MNSMRYLPLLILMLAGNCFAQEVERNYEMGPQITTCDSLSLDELSVEEQIAEIEKTTFRYVQKFRLNRLEGFQGAWFFSCDSKTGIVIAKVDGQKVVYEGIAKSHWENLASTGDFNRFLAAAVDRDKE